MRQAFRRSGGFISIRGTTSLFFRRVQTGSNQERRFMICKGKGKGKVHPRTDHEGLEGVQRQNTTLPLTSALYGVGGQGHASAALPPGKTRYPLYRRLGGPQGRSGRVRKISPPNRNSIPGSSSPQRVAIPTELTRYSVYDQRCSKVFLG